MNEQQGLRNPHGILSETPVGICPACGRAVYHSEEKEGPVWTCPSDLNPAHAFSHPSPVTEEMKEQADDYSNCSSVHGLDFGECETEYHLPLHSACYDANERRY